jgi:hypothetical protein
MANENIQILYPNMCMGPQAGTLCTIDMTNSQTVMRVKNLAGSNVIDYTFSSNILNDNVKMEYVGPYNLPTIVDDLTFFTFERVNSTSCIIKRWQTRASHRELLLKEQAVKYSSGNEKYDATAFSVEFQHRSFAKPNEYYNYVVMSNTDNITTGTKLFFGPSTDTTNLGATEAVTVSSVVTYGDEKRVYLNDDLQYQYATGDVITVYLFVYIFSQLGYANDTSKGTIYKLNAYNWSTVQRSSRSWYKRISAARWCPYVGALASIVNTNMLFIRPYDSYLNWRSMFLKNVMVDQFTTFPVYDVCFDSQSIYKLQDKTTLVSDEGDRVTYNWDTYNYQQDTLLPYTSSVTTWLDQSILTGYYKNIDINAQVRDQYHVSLRDVTLNFYKTGDPDSLFDPLSGLTTTDYNGKAIMNFRSGFDYTGHNHITVRAVGGSSALGSQYVWTSNNIVTYPVFDDTPLRLEQLLELSGATMLRSILSYFYNMSTDQHGNHTFWAPRMTLMNKSFFTTPGGNWGPISDAVFFQSAEIVMKWLPLLYTGKEKQQDSPSKNTKFTLEPWSRTGAFSIGDRITLIDYFDSYHLIKALTDFLIYRGTPVSAHAPYVIVTQPDETGHLQISQLKMSLHTHWVDGDPYDYLWTYITVDQFVFVEDAVPAFWSEKNPVDTNIWIRLRPFAFSLNNNTLRMWIREISPLGDTGYYEITDFLTLTNFDAGGGILGIEALYNPPVDFEHDTTVYVRIEVYDEAYIPNFVYTDYWFMVTPDYKAPYLTNLSPSRGQMYVSVEQPIYFEIVDEGTGIDFDSLEVLLNSRLMRVPELNVEIVDRKYAKVTYTPNEPLYYSKDYKVTVKATDNSYQENKLIDSYMFYTIDSNGVYITDPTPGVCKRGMAEFEDVSVVVLADGNGVDESTIRMQVFNKDVHPRIVPIIYRVS